MTIKYTPTLYQEIKDSPTVKYYTDWKKYHQKLNMKPPEVYDELILQNQEMLKCIINLSLNQIIRGECNIEEQNIDPTGIKYNHEKLLKIHFEENHPSYSLTLDSGKYLLLIPGGKGYTRISLKIDTTPGSSPEIYIVDTGFHEGIKTLYIEYTGRKDTITNIYQLTYHQQHPTYSYIFSTLEDNAVLNMYHAGRAGEMTRIRSDVLLEGINSKYNEIIGFISENASKGDIITNVLHYAPKTESSIIARGIALSHSQLALRGTARVEEKAKNSSTRVETHTIILDNTSKGYAVPMLEIFTGDIIEASHSASVTSVGSEELFYLKSRGFNWKDIELLVKTSIIEITGVLEKVSEYVNIKLY